MNCGLLGQKLGHSYSPQIHSQLADYPYVLFEKHPEELENFLKYGDFTGINVTIPYKKSVIPYCDTLSETAQKIGAVNTIVRKSDGTLVGHNTDYFGFKAMVDRSQIHVGGKKVLVLGSGGASVTAVAVLKELGANVVVISRSGENHYGNLDRHADASVIINATPVGMYPNTGISPVDPDNFPNLEGVLDIVYNPARTQLLLDAEARGLITQNGLWMLVAQAKESAEWFTGNPISDDKICQIHKKLRSQMENVVLIGMPGCGKSTIGKHLAEVTGKSFVDVDEYIVSRTGKHIPQIFTEYGEEGFRQIETEALSMLGKESRLIIATGGGCVTKPENYPLIHQNGTVFWLQRNLDRLPTDGRPLSQTCKLEQMYAFRRPLYDRFSDFTVSNNGDINSTVNAILSLEAQL